jgi:hypothetical protein
VAQPSARGEEAGARDRIRPRSTETDPALSGIDCVGPLDPGLRRSGRRQLWRRTRRPPRCGRPSCGTIVRWSSGIIAQTERRVLHGEAVAANEKIVSLFEPHADIIVKGARDVQYGHKLNLTTGPSGLILDLGIEAGNPADSERSRQGNSQGVLTHAYDR